MSILSTNNRLNKTFCPFVGFFLSFLLFGGGFSVSFGQNSKSSPADDSNKLIKQYIESKMPQIVFNAVNIKQFWIDKSVASIDDNILITLSNAESNPLKIELANINETLDCFIEVLTENPDVSFSILSSNLKTLATSSASDSFISYHISSGLLHLEDVSPSYVFNLKFKANSPSISIKAILLKFSNNQNTAYLSSPGKIVLDNDGIMTQYTTGLNHVSTNSFSVSGKYSLVFSKKNIFVSNNTFSSSVKIKNIGETATHIYVGYALYSKEHILINGNNFPFRGINKPIKVSYSESGSPKIIVDSTSQYGRNTLLALNAKEDLSDIPNLSLTEGKIVSINKVSDNKYEITLDKPLTTPIQTGTNVRVHGGMGAYLFSMDKVLQPGEEDAISTKISHDETFHLFSSKAIPGGVYYVKPVILSTSVDPKESNSVLISDFTVSF